MTTGVASRGMTMVEALWPAAGENRLARNLLLAIVGTGLLTLSAKIQVPIPFVPMTMQTFVVLVIGMAYGWRLGAATVLLYLAEGAAGLPVFASTPPKIAGLAYLMDTTGGFLAGFVVAAALCGWLAERGWDRSLWRTAVAMLLGHAVILLMGFAWLLNFLPLERAYVAGVATFYWATVIKTALAVAVMPAAWKLIGRRSV